MQAAGPLRPEHDTAVVRLAETTDLDVWNQSVNWCGVVFTDDRFPR